MSILIEFLSPITDLRLVSSAYLPLATKKLVYVDFRRCALSFASLWVLLLLGTSVDFREAPLKFMLGAFGHCP